MAKEEILYKNFVSGELSHEMWGRVELPVVQSGLKRVRNFLLNTPGTAEFRPGFYLGHHTRRDNRAKGIKFEFNDEQAYGLEFTNGYLRFYKDDAIITEADKTITGITQASPGVVTSAGHGYASGDEIFITGVKGMTELNGNSYLVVYIGANTFSLTDRDGNAINTTGFAAYSSAGVASKIYEITTPYLEAANLFKLKVTQNADTMYIDHPYYEPRKLTRSGHTSWTLSRYTRTNDPFLAKKVITGATAASPGVITAVAHGYVVGDIVIIEEVVGMTQLNSRVYEVNTTPTADTLTLKDYWTQVIVDTSAYTAYSSAGFLSRQGLLPRAVGFYEGRLFHGGADDTPDQFVGSRSPVPTTGVPRYDDYTAGTDADHAVYFTIADAEVNKIYWFMGTNRLLFAGTFGTETKITGDTSEAAISPSSINVRAENRLGVADVPPINRENIVLYIQRGGLTLRSFDFDALSDSFVSTDRNLVADHVMKSGAKQICWVTGRPDLVWLVMNDGRLVGLTFKSGKEDVAGWHQHDSGLVYGDKFLDCFSLPRANKDDQLWVHTERIVDGHTRRFFEFMADKVDLPQFADYFTGAANREDDLDRFTLDMQEAQKSYMHLDCALTYDGSEPGVSAGATLTPAAVTGTSVVFTASAAVFASTDVGRELWKKAIDGEGYGRAEITGYTSATQVTCNIVDDFDVVTAMAAGDWYITTDTVRNLDHHEGRVVGVVTDGAPHPDETVADGEITLDYQASVIHVGAKYQGHLEPVTVEAGGSSGPAQAKNRNVRKAGIRFFDSLGASFGTDVYDMEDVPFTESPVNVGGPSLPFSGVKTVVYSDNWDVNKTVIVRQKDPLPCEVLFIECWVETDDD